MSSVVSRSVLYAFAILGLALPLAPRVSGQSANLLGQYYDQDKTLRGETWNWNYWRDDNGDWDYQPSEPWTDSLDLDEDGDYDKGANSNEDKGGTYHRYDEHGAIIETWRARHDCSCWAAAASNMLRYVGRENRYYDWVYNMDWPDGSSWTWQHGGGTVKALDPEGYETVSIHSVEGAFPEDIAPDEWILSKLQDGLPVSLGPGSLEEPAAVTHLVTCYGIDTAAQTITIACSDSDYALTPGPDGEYDRESGVPHREYDYVINGDNEFWLQRPYFRGPPVNNARTFATNEWEGDGAGGGSSDWFGGGNWDKGVPGELDFPKVEMLDSPGEVRVDDSEVATAQKLIVKGWDTTVTLDNDARMELGSAFVHSARLQLNPGARLDLNRIEAFDGTIELSGADLRVHALDDGLGDVTFSGGRLLFDDASEGVVDGSLSNWGEVRVEGSSDLDVGEDLDVGHFTADDGDVTVGGNMILGFGTKNIADSTVEVGGDFTSAEDDVPVTNSSLSVPDGDVRIGGATEGGIGLHATMDVAGATLVFDRLLLAYEPDSEAEVVMDSHSGRDPLLWAGNWGGKLRIGEQGAATLTQNAGEIGPGAGPATSLAMTLGYEAGAEGTYNLHGGRAELTGMIVGKDGTGTVNQTDGNIVVDATLNVGFGAGSSGTVNFLGGNLDVDRLTAGAGAAVFNQDSPNLILRGDSHSLGDWNLASQAGTVLSYDLLASRSMAADTVRVGHTGEAELTLNGADLDVDDTLHVGYGNRGTFVHNAGAVTADTIRVSGAPGADNSSYEFSGGTIRAQAVSVAHNGVGQFTQSGDANLETNALIVGGASDSLFNRYRHDGGETLVTGQFRVGNGVGSNAVYRLDQADPDHGTLLTTANAHVGSDGDGRFDHFGGRHVVTGRLVIGKHSGSSGRYSVSGGELEADTIYVSEQGDGAMAHWGGTVDVANLNVGGGEFGGSYDLYGTGLLMADELRVGYATEGEMDQSGGWSHAGTLSVGDAIGAVGTYTHSDGWSNVTGELRLGDCHDSTGSYDQSGAAEVDVGGDFSIGHGDDTVGAYVHTGGNMHVVGAAVLGRGARSTATYAIGDGPESGIAQHIEGSLDIGLGEDSDGFYHVKGRVLPVGGDWSHAGSTTVDGEVRIGGAGAGRLRIDGGGTLTAHDTVAVGSATDPGTLQLDGGAIGGDGSVEVAASNGAITGRGTVDLPVVNDGEIVSTGLNFEEHVSGSGTVTVDADWDTVSFASAELDGAVTNRGTLYAGAPGQTVRLAGGLSGDGTVQVDGGRLEIAADASPGSLDIFMEGTICQESGTTVNAGGVSVGEFGVYRLHETGGATDLSVVGATRVDGEFDHRGGAHASDTLRIGGNPSAYMRVDPAEYRLRSGRLETANLQIGYDPDDFGGAMPVPAGSLAVDRRDAEITVSESLVLGPSARLDIAGGATIHMTGTSFENHSEDPAALADLDRLKLVFEGGAADADPFEVAGENVGADLGGFRENFALGTLELGGADIGHVLLRDAVDNQLDGDLDNEAQYVKMLTLGAGSTLDLDGLDLYYLNACIDASATVTGGTATAVAPPDARAEIEGVAPGSVTVTYDHGSSGPMGTGGIGAFGDVAALSGTVVLDPDEIDAAVAASPSGYVTFKLYYDESEVELWEIDEASLRPYWWSGAEWVPGGTTTTGDPGEGAFAGLDTAPADFGMGYYGLDTGANFLWSNITHASMYGAGGNQAAAIPEPATAALFALAAALLARRRR